MHDYFLCAFLDEKTQQKYAYGMWPGHDLDRESIGNHLRQNRIITFNGKHYDEPMLTMAMAGGNTEFLKNLNDAIIVGGFKPWDVYRHYNVESAIPDHVDLYEVAPGVRIGLKQYAGRMHCERLQDLPFDPNERPDAGKRMVLTDYCINSDLVATNALKHEVKDRIALREAMSEKYGVDLRSKSDAQMAEAVMLARLPFKPNERYIPHGFTFPYVAPPYLRFVSPQLQNLLVEIQRLPFEVHDKQEVIEIFGESMGISTGVKIPPSLKGRDIIIGKNKYRMGIGGLHSQEKVVSYRTDATHVIWDIDVTSYYPSLIRTMGMYPEQSGLDFLTIYDEAYWTRLKAKANAAKLADMGLLGQEYIDEQTEADGLKIFLNGIFGKLFSKYSRPCYAPELGIRTTVTGQLDLLMLIEMMELTGIECVSANTDGIVLRIPRTHIDIARANVKWWEKTTGLGMEETHYTGIYSRDVNNYVAITDKGKVKRKGVFAQGGVLSGPQGKGPNADICADAVVNYLKDGTPLEFTIMGCKDIRKFVVIRACKGGAVDLPETVAIDDAEYLGKTVRWYWSTRKGYLGSKGTGAKVADSDWATPVMTLPKTMPLDVNYAIYINRAKEMLTNIGVTYER